MSVSLIHPIIINNGQLHNGTLTSSTEKQNTSSTSNIYGNNVNSKIRAHYNNQSDKLALLDTKLYDDTNKENNFNSSSLGDINKSEAIIEINTEVPTLTTTENEMNSQIPLSSTPKTASSSTTEHTLFSTSKSYSKISKDYISTATITNNNNEIIYKFFVPRNVGVATARITFGQVCMQCPDVGFHIQANAFPNIEKESRKNHEDNYMHSTIIKPNQTGEISIEFYVQPMTWHYALLKFVNQNFNVVSAQSRPQQLHKLDRYKTIKADYETTKQYQLPYVLQIDLHEATNTGDNNNDNDDGDEKENSDTGMNKTKSSKKSNVWRPNEFRGMDFYPLLRQTYREFFMYDYDLMPDENGTVPTLLNLTAGMPAGFAFDVGEVYDIGGTLSFAVSMKHSSKMSTEEAVKAMPSIPSTSEHSGILAEKLIGGPNIDSNNDNDNSNGMNKEKSDDKTLSRSNQTIIVCMHLGEPGEPVWPDKCRYGGHLLPASSIVNNTDYNTSTGLVHVPFPESGKWYITMGLYCHGAETASRATIIDSVKEFVKKYIYMLEYMRTPCACATKLSQYRNCVNDPNCLNSMNETETLKLKECLMDSKCTSNHLEMTRKFEVHHKIATEQRFALDNCSTSVVFTISSSPCVVGRCGRYGRCYHYMSGGFVFSTCVCMKGYRGWDCTEDSQVPSSMSILMASLLLTLSNLLFLPSIYIASRRQFYTEAVIYFFAMFFSVFYHACDSGEDEYSFCLVKIGVLQFCDFYCGLLAIWVTLVAMSHVRQQFVSLLHMLGAILLAFGTELNKQSLWVFLAPALTGICLISASWGMRCYKTRKWFPARRYLTVYMPLGTVLVMVGLICYAFLQTKQNYHIVHSIWHMVMALSILCLLPSRKSFIPKC